MMTRIAIRKNIICLLATFLNKKPKPLSQEVEEIKDREEEEISSDVPINTIVMPIRITFDNPIDFNDYFSKPKDLKKDLTISFDSTTYKTRSTETSDGLAVIQAQLNKFGREIKKVNEKVYAAQVGCELCKGPRYTKDCPLKEEGKTLEEAYYTQFGVPFQQGGQYRAAAPRFYKRNKANPSYQERRC
ncbi:hypothetical protein Tco_0558530 [Tanacetum coccineum]